jgi:hypothetical protein
LHARRLTKIQTQTVVPDTVLKDLHEEYKDTLILATCNTAQYRVPVDLFHVPTIKLYPATKKDLPVEYFGKKEDADQYVLFIQKEGNTAVKVGPKGPIRWRTRQLSVARSNNNERVG